MPVQIFRQGTARKVPTRALKNIALEILQMLQIGEAELSIALVGNAEIQELNVRFRQKDAPTDVLSFPMGESSPPGLRMLGDVVISVEKALAQANQRRRTLHEELVTLLIHGILHLLGYDHERSARDATIMRALERKLYRALCERGLMQV